MFAFGFCTEKRKLDEECIRVYVSVASRKVGSYLLHPVLKGFKLCIEKNGVFIWEDFIAI